MRLQVALLLLLSTFAVAGANDDVILFCNYDVLFAVDDSVGQINSRSRVRDGHTLPIEFQHHKIDIVIADDGEGGVTFAVTLFEKSGEFWYQINPEPLTFAGAMGIPVQYQWSEGRLSLDVAIAVSSNQGAASP